MEALVTMYMPGVSLHEWLWCSMGSIPPLLSDKGRPWPFPRALSTGDPPTSRGSTSTPHCGRSPHPAIGTPLRSTPGKRPRSWTQGTRYLYDLTRGGLTSGGWDILRRHHTLGERAARTRPQATFPWAIGVTMFSHRTSWGKVDHVVAHQR